MTSQKVKIVIFVPPSHADKVREAMGEAGAGKIGNYGYCTFSTTGTGRFLPQAGATPTVGNIGELESVEEERIETVCEKSRVGDVITAVKLVHPYEEAPFDILPLLTADDL